MYLVRGPWRYCKRTPKFTKCDWALWLRHKTFMLMFFFYSNGHLSSINKLCNGACAVKRIHIYVCLRVLSQVIHYDLSSRKPQTKPNVIVMHISRYFSDQPIEEKSNGCLASVAHFTMVRKMGDIDTGIQIYVSNYLAAIVTPFLVHFILRKWKGKQYNVTIWNW